MDSKFKLIVDSFGKEKFKFNEPLRDYTISGIGGPAKLFFIAFTTSELIKIVAMARGLSVPLFLFGTGSKIAIAETGFTGLVVKNRTKNIQVVSVKGKASRYGIGVEEAIVEVDSGVSIGKFVEFLDTQRLASGEFRSMPGSIGGNLFLSKSLQNKAKSIKVLNLQSEVEEISPSELQFRKHIILSAIFKMKAKT